ncbi:MAG: response regulator [Flavobacteriales bacterium]|jgi:response regulator RpfG family c-di-GMP phosphodiesterase|nr:response regulator [Flavobacteriales bacterium]
MEEKKDEAPKKSNILYIDDERSNLMAFKASFRRHYNIFIADNVVDAREILEENEIEIILTDQRMPDMTGVEFLQSVIPDHPEPMRILVTGYSDIQAVIDAINKGQVYKYISKPWENNYLKVAIDKALEVYSLRKENKELTKSLLKANQQLEFMLRQKLI